MKLMTMWLITFMLLLILLMIMLLTQKKMKSDKEKWSQFECGFSFMNPSHMPFSFQFFLIAILFLIFDIEISMLLSFPLEVMETKNKILVFLFITVLTMGLMYEWQKSKINWSN